MKNVHSIRSWFCICHQYSGCPLIKDFIKRQKRYCCICQFQDRFNLWELNEIKGEIKKIKNYYMDITTAVCEIKKVTTCEENLWERDIQCVIKNDCIHTYSNEMKKFFISIIDVVGKIKKLSSNYFILGDEICFGLNSHNVQLCVVSFCFGYYLGKSRTP